jgi:Fe2+ or Zn2+ uptake regulation protein
MKSPLELPTSSTADWDNRLATLLRARGHRVTSQRLVLHRALREYDRHVTADELLSAVASRLPGISIPTVYATLDLFDELGLVRRVAAGRGAVLFDPRADAHHHTVCNRCGRVEDLETKADLDAVVAGAQSRGFAPRSAEVTVSGLCAECR